MRHKVIEMKEKYQILYKFFLEVLCLNEKDALKNTLKLQGTISESTLSSLTKFINYTNDKLANDENYLSEFKKFYKRIKRCKKD